MLSKHRFEPDIAASEMATSTNGTTYPGGYKKWVADNRLPEVSAAPPTPVQRLINTKRKTPPNRTMTANKIKRPKRDADESDNSSGGSISGDYKDRRVYDR